MQIQEQLLENIQLIQAVHAVYHEILDVQHKDAMRRRWTKSEDDLLCLAIHIFGSDDLTKLSSVVLSKSEKQIYFRLRYINANENVLSSILNQ
ncbi:SANT/Myb_domain [Hexamita inflata]|uniref:SANT/Myb domain n=1 Tax=Hexamita inflata TaxID=28002 RepID=A0AA86NZ23_9EUKA|nr:SANT/Myb domain [Hexamita inflata]